MLLCTFNFYPDMNIKKAINIINNESGHNDK